MTACRLILLGPIYHLQTHIYSIGFQTFFCNNTEFVENNIRILLFTKTIVKTVCKQINYPWPETIFYNAEF